MLLDITNFQHHVGRGTWLCPLRLSFGKMMMMRGAHFHHHYSIEWIAGYAYNGREIVLEDSTANISTASSKIIATFIMIVSYCQPMSLLVKESDMPSSPTAVKIGEEGLLWPWSKPTHPLSWLHWHMPSSLSAFIHSAGGPIGFKNNDPAQLYSVQMILQLYMHNSNCPNI